ncbi:MAG: hypothetical protein LLG01_00700 [Planctomycetaceae bacterium]|nr:hypothetical protein [Planctomycetaceae bacterium]
MNIEIKRSEKYIQARRLATGRNEPEIIIADVDPAALSEDNRRLILQWCGGQYPDILCGLRITEAGTIASRVMSHEIQHRMVRDVEVDQITPEMVDETISAMGAAAQVALEAQLAEAERKAAEEAQCDRDRTAAMEAFFGDPAARARINCRWFAGRPDDTDKIALPTATIYRTDPQWHTLATEVEQRNEADAQANLEQVERDFLADPTIMPRDIRDDRMTINGWYYTPEWPRWASLRAEALHRQQAADEAAHAEENAWIAEHGSTRLKRLVAENIEHEAVYLEERLTLERPGWAYDADVQGEAKEPRNSKQEGLDLLDEARKTDPEAQLVWWVVDNSDDPDREDTHAIWKGYACTAEFLGRDIVFGVPKEYAC